MTAEGKQRSAVWVSRLEEVLEDILFLRNTARKRLLCQQCALLHEITGKFLLSLGDQGDSAIRGQNHNIGDIYQAAQRILPQHASRLEAIVPSTKFFRRFRQASYRYTDYDHTAIYGEYDRPLPPTEDLDQQILDEHINHALTTYTQVQDIAREHGIRLKDVLGG